MRLVRMVLGLAVGVMLAAAAVPAAAQNSPDALLARGADLIQRGEYRQTLALLDPVDASGWSPRQSATRQQQRATALNETGQYDKALEAADAGERSAQAAGAVDLLARLGMARGTGWRHRGRPLEAIRHYRAALVYAEQAKSPALQAAVYLNLSSCYQTLGEWERVLDFAERGYRLTADAGDGRRASYMMQRGIALFEFHDRDGAERAFQEVLAIRRRQSDVRGMSFALGELGYLAWEFDRNRDTALRYYDEAIAKASAVPVLKTTWLLDSGNVFRDVGDYPEALRRYREALALELATNQVQHVAALHKNIGQVLAALGQVDDARRTLQTALAEADRQDDGPRRWQARLELARLDVTSDPAAADGYFASAIDFFEQSASNVLLDNYRAGAFARELRRNDPYDTYIRFLMDRREPERAFLVAERARARAFLDTLSGARDEIARGVPPEFVRAENALLDRITRQQAALRALGDGANDAAARQTLAGDVRRAEDDLDALRLRLAVEHPGLAHARYPRVWNVSELRSQMLSAGEALLMFFLGERESWAWRLTADRLETFRLQPRKAIEARAADLLQRLRTPGGDATRVTAAELLGVDPTSGLPPDTRVIIVPHGILHYVPFEALADTAGQYLIERLTIAYAPSASSYAYLRQKRRAAGGAVLAFGNPVMTGAEPATDRAAAPLEWIGRLKPLPHSGTEVRAIASLFGSDARVLEQQQATEASLHDQAVGSARVLHFATHALIDEERPERSGLALTATPPAFDGILQMREVYGLRLSAALVTLSGCETALGRQITGEGIVGLSRAFLNAGAGAVMASLWNVGDASTADLMTAFYRRVRDGADLDLAAREAKREFIRAGDRRRHPYYWAAFILTGDTGTNAGLAAPPLVTPARLAIAAGAIALIAAMYVIARRRRRTAAPPTA